MHFELRQAGPLCDGCHSVNYDVKTKAVTEWNVGCERCHGAGGLHVRDKEASSIVNPARLDDKGNLEPEFAICVDNGDAEVLNVDLGNGSENVVVGDSQHRCTHQPLPAVTLEFPEN